MKNFGEVLVTLSQGLDGVLAVTADRLYFCPIERKAARTGRAPCGPAGPKVVALEEVRCTDEAVPQTIVHAVSIPLGSP